MRSSQSTFQQVRVVKKKDPVVKLPRAAVSQAEVFRISFWIMFLIIALVSVWVVFSPKNSEANSVAGFVFQSDSVGQHVPDGVQEPTWFPFLGKATVGCTTGNPSADGKKVRCRTTSGGPYHPWPAIDLHIPAGKPVRASGAGTVVRVNQNPSEAEDDPTAGSDESSYDGLEARAGFYLAIAHKDNPASTYKHMSEVFVKEGEIVERGQVIGLAGKTASPNYHTHYDEQKYYEKDDLRFNTPESRVPLGAMLARQNNAVRKLPNYLGFNAWNKVPYGTALNSDGYSTEPQVVANQSQLQGALLQFSRTTEEGPFIIKLQADIVLNGTLTYSGDELLILEGGEQSRQLNGNGNQILRVTSNAPIEIRRINLVQSVATQSGGAISSKGDVTLIESKVSNNRSNLSGGAIYSEGNVVAVRTYMHNNSAGTNGGAIAARSLRVAESTFRKNNALNGGALYAGASADSSNSTYSQNTATTKGGAIMAQGRLQLRHNTFYQNSAAVGSSLASDSSMTALANVITLGVNGNDCSVSQSLVLGYNVESATSCGFEISNIADAGLNILQDNGGFTPTHKPTINSILRNAFVDLPKTLTGYKYPTVCDTSSAIDQRGAWMVGTTWKAGPTEFVRPLGGACDIGSVEIP